MPIHKILRSFFTAIVLLACALACGGLDTSTPVVSDSVDVPIVVTTDAVPEPPPPPVQPVGPSPATIKARAVSKCKSKCNSKCRGRSNKAKCVGQCRRACG